jgi:hypothetical protein
MDQIPSTKDLFVPFSAEAPKFSSSIYFGNIPFDSKDEELRETVEMAGPFKEFKVKTD